MTLRMIRIEITLLGVPDPEDGGNKILWKWQKSFA